MGIVQIMRAIMPAEVTVVEETIKRNKRRLTFAAISASLALTIVFMLHIVCFLLLTSSFSMTVSLGILIAADFLLMALLSLLGRTREPQTSKAEEVAREHISSQVKWSLALAALTGLVSVSKFFSKKPETLPVSQRPKKSVLKR